jgi:hypothetical protein
MVPLFNGWVLIVHGVYWEILTTSLVEKYPQLSSWDMIFVNPFGPFVFRSLFSLPFTFMVWIFLVLLCLSDHLVYCSICAIFVSCIMIVQSCSMWIWYMFWNSMFASIYVIISAGEMAMRFRCVVRLCGNMISQGACKFWKFNYN